MSVELVIRDSLGERPVGSGDFPLAIGGRGSTIPLPGLPEGTAAWIAIHDGQLFLQPEAGSHPFLCNGAHVARSTWLRDGDVVDAGSGRLRLTMRGDTRVLEVEDSSAGNLTLPPVQEPSGVVVGAGGEDEERIEVLAFSRAAERPPASKRITTARLVVGSALVLLALVSWYFWSGHAVSVHTLPVAESVTMRGPWPVLRYGDSYFAQPGDYTLVARKVGYETATRRVTVEGRSGQHFELTLRKLPGRLQVATSVAARVVLDGRPAGTAPGVFKVAAGTHVIEVLADRYQPFKRSVAVTGEDKLQVLDAKLVPAWAVVTVLSEPAAASVVVGGRDRGVTPLEVELDAGSQRVELRHPGFKTWAADVLVVANQPQTLGPVRLGLPDAHLSVRSNPAGASVSVGGAFRGRTPVEVDVPPEVATTLLLARDGYEPGSATVTLNPGERRTVALSLVPILGEVTVQAEPPDADVVVDGRVLGRVGQTYKLPAAPSDLEVRAPGYRSYRTRITPRPGLPQIVTARLEFGRSEAVAQAPGASPSAASSAAPPPAATQSGSPSAPGGPPAAVIRSKAGQELRLMPVASYTMGSPRREAGRRANESQRAVELRRRYYLAAREVTNAEYRQFRAAHRSGYVGQSTLELDRQPVVAVSWQEAAVYCNWLSALDGLPAAYVDKGGTLVAAVPATTGYRLPTEAEWEWAARSASGGALRRYPWGDAMPVPPGAGNYADRSAQALLQVVLEYYDDGHPVTAPVGSFAANSQGLFDMGGNVAEWTSDIYTVQPPTSAVAVDPWAAGEGSVHVIRGSSWRQASVSELRATFRDYGEGRRDDLGFRLARYAE